MPQLSDLVEKRTVKKFVKKSYRPWDLSGAGTEQEPASVAPANSAPEANINAETTIPSVEVTPIETPAIEQKNAVKQAVVIQAATPKVEEQKASDILEHNIGHKKEHDQNTFKKQLDNNQITIKPQTGHELRNDLDHNTDTTNLTDTIKRLWGIQRSLFFVIVEICASRGTLDTGAIQTSDLITAINCNENSIKTSLARLVEKNLVIRHRGKTSRGGHVVLGITKDIQIAAAQAQKPLVSPVRIVPQDHILRHDLGHNNTYSSSKYINTTTSLPEEWKKINFEPLSHIGFSETQLRQLHDSNMTTPEVVQDAINRFAYSLEYSDKAKAYSDPLNVLMGVLRKGQRWNEPNYVPAKELALRQLLEEKRKQKDQRNTMMKELADIEFPDWRKNLTEEQVKQIVPADTLKTNLTAAITAALRTYFYENVLAPRFDEENKMFA